MIEGYKLNLSGEFLLYSIYPLRINLVHKRIHKPSDSTEIIPKTPKPHQTKDEFGAGGLKEINT